MGEHSDIRSRRERAAAGALRSAIAAHGPVTLEQVGSAAKRVVAQLDASIASEMEQDMARLHAELSAVHDQVERLEAQLHPLVDHDSQRPP